jgi:PPOX class probable F420-dependent enzyme
VPLIPSQPRLDTLPAWAHALLDEERVGHLGLIDDDGRPRVLPVIFAVFEGAVWSAVDDKPKRVAGGELARVRWLRARPGAALTVDRYDDDWNRLAWVQLVGEVAIVEVAGQEPALDALAARYCQYRQRSPRGPLLRLTPQRIVHWRARQ